ncbi:MAG: NAD-dependent deacylase [Candidatus Goldbacteria bacterium]|nr:NAD-dependent deacylase [Candidatus Goldiibacteriota bacterium]
MMEIKKLIELIESSDYITALTGAGISTLSGIPDFRGGYNPIWDKYPQDKVFNYEYFNEHPQMFFDFLREILGKEYQPNVAHFFLKFLETRKKLKAIITQNIDGLHKLAGSRNVYELHGSIYSSRCLKCGQSYAYEIFMKKLFVEKVVSCKCSGVIKPDIVFFGEMLPPEDLKMAIYNATHSDLMLIIGTSLVVQPAAFMPMYTLNNGGKVVLINKGETYIDDRAILKFNDIEEVFNALREYYEIGEQ